MDQMDYEMHQAEVPTSQAPAHPATHSGFQGVPPQGQGGCPFFRNEQQHRQPSGLPHLHPSYPHYHHGVNSLYHLSRQNQGPHAPRPSHSRNLSLQPHHHPQQPSHGQLQQQQQQQHQQHQHQQQQPQQQQQQQTQPPPLSLPLPHSQSHSHSLSHPHPHSHYDPIYPGWSSSAQSASPAYQWVAPASAPGPPPPHAVPLLAVPLQLQSILRPSGSDQFFPNGGAGSTNPSGSNSVLPSFHSNQNLPHLDSTVPPPFSFPFRHPSALHRFSVAPAIQNHQSHSGLPQAPSFPQASTQNQTHQLYQSQPGREALSSVAMNTDRPSPGDAPAAQSSQAASGTNMSSNPSSGAGPASSGLPQPVNGSGEPSRRSDRGPGSNMASGQLPLPEPRPMTAGDSTLAMYRGFSGEQRRSVIRRARAELAQPTGDDYDESEEDYSPIDDDDEAYRFATQFGHGYMPDESRLRQQQLLRGQMSSNKRVASKKALASLQSVDMESLTASERTCVICYNDFGVTSPEGISEAPLRLPKCKHIFGDHCIKKWFEESDSCPYCRDKVPSDPAMPPSVQGYIRATGEFVGMPYRHGPEPGSRLPTHPPSRSVQSGERRASPSDPSTESMRRTRPRFGAARGYGPPASNFATSSGSRPGPPHGAFPSMAGFPGSVGAAPPGPFQPSGPPGASAPTGYGQQQQHGQGHPPPRYYAP
ncbi:Putative protein of unknown function [Podospora comata]|uniref:RING-type domain-containing protein n=1 Tax=Podospora comata TaxID=48703 RepID=A0ABY6RYM4_PODCO|nr:Putative protein of unknown function [Podospora comata]